jgi:hypothetical protein
VLEFSHDVKSWSAPSRSRRDAPRTQNVARILTAFILKISAWLFSIKFDTVNLPIGIEKKARKEGE